jgi:microcin C transport system permease protein
MRNYFLRRVLLIPPTLFGITLLVFVITRFVPGGPLERAIMEAQQMNAAGRSGSVSGQGQALSEAQIQQLEEYYGFDKPWYQSYVQWVGKLLRGDLGSSYRYNEPVLSIMKDHFPVSLFFGISTIIATYVVCIPLGVIKAIRHRTVVDNLTSVVIFMGYAVPGYVLGTLLLLFFAARLEWFPMSGFTSMDYPFMTTAQKAADVAKHAVLPLVCYLVGSFAVTTLLMKNHLMDNLAADYIRTAVAKGVSFRRAVIGHALRNSLIPIATTFGQNMVLIVTGSFLIETIFDINGFGLLGVSAIFDRDYPVVMGVVFAASLALLIGNIVSDALVAAVDPRIRFS